MTAKILKENTEVLNRSTNQALTQDKWERHKFKDEHMSFMDSFQRLDPQATLDDLADLGAEDMTQYDPNKDESQDDGKFFILYEEPEVTTEWGDQY